MGQLFTSGGQSIGVSTSASVLPMNTQDWYPLRLTGLTSLQSKGLSRAFSCTTIWKYQLFGTQPSFIVQLSLPYMTTGKTIALTIWTFVSKMMSLSFNTLSRFVFSSGILGINQLGEFIFQCYIFFILFMGFSRQEYWMVCHSLLQWEKCTGDSDEDHPQEKEMQKRQNGCLKKPYKELRKEVKGKGEKERYTHLNAEFQRIARRDKKAFLSDQCKEVEENIRMGKTRDLFKKIRDTKGTFHAKMSTIKDRNGMDLTEAEDIKKRWQEYRRTIQKRSSWPR